MASNTSMKREDNKQGKNVQVVVRCRPFSAAESKGTHSVVNCDPNRREVTVKTGGFNDKAARHDKAYTFDMVFGPAAKQIDVYRSVVCPILDEVIMGYNCTVFAYGQTGTGKTFTMEGERSPEMQVTWEDDPLAGIIPRTLHQIFEKLSESGSEFSVKVSLLEIYNEELFDLLSPGEDVGEKLQLFDDPNKKRGVVVKGLEEITVHNKNEVYSILERGSAKRKTAATLMNAYSSRSHSVFSITVIMKEITLEGEDLVKIGKLNLVDLAGSENIGRSGSQDKRAREAGNINQSLLTLGRVITALVEKRPHVPYRESKLTRILQDSLGGRTKTSIIATVSPSSCNTEETTSTLDYASRAKNIMNKPEINQKMTKKTLIKEYTEEIERLKRDLAAARDKNGVYLSTENYSHMSEQITSQEETIAGYLEKISAAEEEMKKAMELFTDTQSQLEQCTVQLEERDHRLDETTKALVETAQQLTEEQFICSDLTSTQEKLYNTADQLLNTAHISTSHVSGLHDKLDRKKEVDQQNTHVQQSFSQRMDHVLGDMEGSVSQQASKHRSTLASYTSSMDTVLSVNKEALRGAVSTMESFMGGVTQLVAQGVAGFQDKVHQQEALCSQNRDGLLEMLEEFKQDLQEALAVSLLPSVEAIRTLNEAMRKTVEEHRAQADKVEAIKEVGTFLTSHVQALAELRTSSLDALCSLEAENDSLSQRIRQESETQQLEMDQMIQCLQSQLSLLAINNKTRFDGLSTASRALQAPVQNTKEAISTRCSEAEKRVTVQADLLSSTVPSLAAAIRHTAQETDDALEESTGYCSLLQRSLTDLGERHGSHCSRAQERVQNQAQEQMALLEQNSAANLALQERVESHANALLPDTRAQLTGQQEKVTQMVRSLQNQVSVDQTVLDQQHAELQNHVESSQELLHSFHQELRQDVPTGMTPQRREFEYPRELVKSRRRPELLESLRLQQEELQATIELQATTDALEVEREQEAEQHRVEQDLLEVEAEAASVSFENDENLVCSNEDRGPFFKASQQRKKKRVPAKTETHTTPRSKLPLRAQN